MVVFPTFAMVRNGFDGNISFPAPPSLGASLGLSFVPWPHFWYEINLWCAAERLTAHGQSLLQPALNGENERGWLGVGGADAPPTHGHRCSFPLLSAG